MIYASFDSNLRPVTETYSGLGGAMLEACASDMAMFKAMLKLDAIEIKLNESAESDTKEEKQSKMEKAKNMASGAWSGLKERVAKMLEWLGEKINQAAAAVTAQFNKLFTADAGMLKAKLKSVKQDEISGLTIKWQDFGVHNPFKIVYNFPEFEAGKTYSGESIFKGKFDKFLESSKSGPDAFKIVSDFFSKDGHKKISEFASAAVKFKAKLNKTAAGYRKNKGADDNAKALYDNCQKYRNTCLASMRDLQNAMKKQYGAYRRALRQLLAGKAAKDEAALLEFYLQDGDIEVENMFECVITGCPVENLMAESVAPEVKSHEKGHTEIMQSMAEPLF